MDADALVAALQEALPGVAIEPAPSIDLQPTIYVPRGRPAGGRRARCATARSCSSRCSPS